MKLDTRTSQYGHGCDIQPGDRIDVAGGTLDVQAVTDRVEFGYPRELLDLTGRFRPFAGRSRIATYAVRPSEWIMFYR